MSPLIRLKEGMNSLIRLKEGMSPLIRLKEGMSSLIHLKEGMSSLITFCVTERGSYGLSNSVFFVREGGNNF